MNKLISQHWEGHTTSFIRSCMQTIREYAERIGADYEFSSGTPLEGHHVTAQKLHVCRETFDRYDLVATIDPDVVAIPELSVDIFEHSTGVSNLVKTEKAKEAKVFLPNGGVHVLNKRQRKLIRENIERLAYGEPSLSDEDIIVTLRNELGAHEFPYREGDEWNCQPRWYEVEDIPEAYLYHFCGWGNDKSKQHERLMQSGKYKSNNLMNKDKTQ